MAWDPPELPLIGPSPEISDVSKHYLVDVRDAAVYAAAHVPNAVNIALRGRFETWVGMMVPWEADTVLVGDEPQLREATHRLHRVGYEPQCLLMEEWKSAGLPLKSSKTITPRELYAQMQSPESPVVVDVRLPAEWMALRIGTVVNIPLNHLAEESVKLDPLASGDCCLQQCVSFESRRGRSWNGRDSRMSGAWWVVRRLGLKPACRSSGDLSRCHGGRTKTRSSTGRSDLGG